MLYFTKAICSTPFPSLLSTGCQWALPKDLPPESTVHDYFSLWRSDRTLLLIAGSLATSNAMPAPSAHGDFSQL